MAQMVLVEQIPQTKVLDLQVHRKTPHTIKITTLQGVEAAYPIALVVAPTRIRQKGT